ncbi:MAG: hypothetical protein E7199_08585 [Schwartzia succinivorans]|nr:hypothetical protein [Schwartzia succinivorans]
MAADAVGNEADAGREMEADVAQENKDATATLQQTSQDTEFDDPLILLVLRHLQAEWRDFMKSEQYKEMPEDELQAAKRLDAPRIRQRSEAVKAVSLTAAAAAYQTAAEK